MNKQRVLSSMFGVAIGNINRKNDKTWTLHIELYKRGSKKIGGYLTQSGHATKTDALKSWYNLQSYIEIHLSTLGE